MDTKILDQIQRAIFVVIALTIICILFAPKSYGQKFQITNVYHYVWQLDKKPVAKIKSSRNDTLVIDYEGIVLRNYLFKYVKVGDKLFKEVEEIQPSNFGFNGSVLEAKPLIIYNEGYAIAAPATVPLVDTSSVNYKSFDPREPLSNTWIIGGSEEENYFKGNLLPTKKQPKTYEIPEFIGKSESCGMFDKNRFKYVWEDHDAYKKALLKKYKDLTPAKACKVADLRFPIIHK